MNQALRVLDGAFCAALQRRMLQHANYNYFRGSGDRRNKLYRRDRRRWQRGLRQGRWLPDGDRA